MPEFLRDPVWQFIGAALGVIVIIVMIILYRRQERHKELSCVIFSHTPLDAIEPQVVRRKLQISYDGKPVQDVHVLRIAVVNSGNVPITSADYESPITLRFGNEARVLTADIAGSEPNNLRPSIEGKEQFIVMQPALFNQGDFIVLELLVSKYKPPIKVDGRIIGVKDISIRQRIAPPQDKPLSKRAYTGFLLTTYLLVGVLVLSLEAAVRSPDNPAHKIVALVSFTLATLSTLFLVGERP